MKFLETVDKKKLENGRVVLSHEASITVNLIKLWKTNKKENIMGIVLYFDYNHDASNMYHWSVCTLHKDSNSN